jgi:hypothetical protein
MLLLPGFSGRAWKVSCHSGNSERAIGTRSLGHKRNLAAHSSSALGVQYSSKMQPVRCRVEDLQSGSPEGRSMMLGDCSQTCRAVGWVKSSKDWNYRNVEFLRESVSGSCDDHPSFSPPPSPSPSISDLPRGGAAMVRKQPDRRGARGAAIGAEEKERVWTKFIDPTGGATRDHWQAPKLDPTWTSLAENATLKSMDSVWAQRGPGAPALRARSRVPLDGHWPPPFRSQPLVVTSACLGTTACARHWHSRA